MKYCKLSFLIFFSALFTQISFSQCLKSGDIGGFESAKLTDQWWTGTQGNGSITVDNSTYYAGSKAVKIEVTTPSTWQVRMYHNQCFFNINSGSSYRITVYAKGNLGTSFDVTLMNNSTSLSSQNVKINATTWQKYQVVLNTGVTSTQGRIKLSFKETGTYYIDELQQEEISMSPISITHPLLCWEGVMESEMTTSGELRNFRFPKTYATANLSGYYTAERASSSAGMVLKFSSSSPSVNLSFKEDLTWAGDVFYHKMSVYKNGSYLFNSNDFDLSLSNSSGAVAHWKITMPTYTQMNLKSIELEDGHVLENTSCNSKPVYIAIGNSITMGVGLTENDSRESYTRIIADSLGYELYNWGIGGSKIHDTVYSNLKNSNLTPDLITVLWGYNDVHYAANDAHFSNSTVPKYKQLLTAILTNYPNTCVVAILPTYTTNPKKTTVRTMANLEAEQLNIINNLQASFPKLGYLKGSDYTTVQSLSDAVHLNNQGNQSLAHGIISELNCDVLTHEINIVKPELTVSPNPTFGKIHWNTPKRYKLFNLSGQILIQSYGNEINLSHLANGIYFLQTPAETHKIIKQ